MQWIWLLIYSIGMGFTALLTIALIPSVNGKPAFLNDIFIVLSVTLPVVFTSSLFWYLCFIKKWKRMDSIYSFGVFTAILTLLFNPVVWLLILATYTLYIFIYPVIIVLSSILFGWLYNKFGDISSLRSSI